MKYPLPKFPNHIAPAFKKLCQPIPVEDIPALRLEIFNYMGRAEEENNKNTLVNLPLARQIAQIASFLLDNYEDYSDVHKGLIVGAVNYFISDGDGISDFNFASGLNDDAQILNHVLEKLKIKDKFIQI